MIKESMDILTTAFAFSLAIPLLVLLLTFLFGSKNRSTKTSHPVVNILLVVWAGLAMLLGGTMAFGEGHPPGVLFVPVVWVIFLMGHLVLWYSGKSVAEAKSLWAISLAKIGLCLLTPFLVLYAFGALSYLWRSANIGNILMEVFLVAGCLVNLFSIWGLFARKSWGFYVSLVMLGFWTLAFLAYFGEVAAPQKFFLQSAYAAQRITSILSLSLVLLNFSLFTQFLLNRNIHLFFGGGAEKKTGFHSSSKGEEPGTSLNLPEDLG